MVPASQPLALAKAVSHLLHLPIELEFFRYLLRSYNGMLQSHEA